MWRCKLCGGLIGFQNAMTHEGYSVIHSVVCLDCGNTSKVIGLGTHTENEEKYVIYKEENSISTDFWIRPVAIFTDIITIKGGKPTPLGVGWIA